MASDSRDRKSNINILGEELLDGMRYKQATVILVKTASRVDLHTPMTLNGVILLNEYSNICRLLSLDLVSTFFY